MNEKNIKPEKITKPIQLLAVWLLGLILIESSLLTAAGIITRPEWLPAFFGISAVSIIPLFLVLIFLLQTKFRPQIQEDEYYSKYLDKNTMQFIDDNPTPKLTIDLVRQEISQIVKETQDNFINIKNKIDKGENKESLEKLITISDSKIAELERYVKFSSISLHINKTIKTFSSITNVVKRIGFSRYDEFGEAEIPQNFLVSFTKTVPPIIIRDLIIELIPLGASFINLVKDEEVIRRNYGNEIFVGSYLYKKPDVIGIEQKILNRITALNEESKISDLISI